MSKQELLDAVLGLPREDRARFVRELIRSLDEPADPDAAAAWVSEIQRRYDEVHAGTAKLVDWSEVRARIQAKLDAQK